MNDREAARVVAEITASWPQRAMTDPEMAVWRQTLSPIPLEAGLVAVSELRAVHDWTPTHHQFLVAAQDAGRRLASQHPERVLATTDPVDDGSCHRCGDTGWAEVEVAGPGLSAVERCRCSKGRTTNRGLDEDYEHPGSCSCHVCTYGPAKARAGRRAREGDPLGRVIDAAPPRMPYVEEEF